MKLNEIGPWKTGYGFAKTLRNLMNQKHLNKAGKALAERFIVWYERLPKTVNGKDQPISLKLFEQFLLSSKISKELLQYTATEWQKTNSATENLQPSAIVSYFTLFGDVYAKDLQGMLSDDGKSIADSVTKQKSNNWHDDDRPSKQKSQPQKNNPVIDVVSKLSDHLDDKQKALLNLYQKDQTSYDKIDAKTKETLAKIGFLMLPHMPIK